MKKLKVAVQFFGHLRSFEQCFPSLKKNLFDLYDCDIFMHTWSKSNHQSHAWSKDNSEQVYEINEKILNKINCLYKLKLIKVEKQENIDTIDIPIMHTMNESKVRYLSAQAMKSMLYSKMQVNLLRNQYEKKYSVIYDYVIMLRPDIKLLSPLDISNIVQQMKVTSPDVRYCALSIKFDYSHPLIGNLLSDILYLATPNVMNKTVDILNNIKVHLIGDGMWNPESLYINELLKNGVGSNFFYYFHGKDWLIVRDNNSKKIRSKIISLRIRKRFISLKIFSIIPFSFFDIKINIFNQFYFMISLGKNRHNLIDDLYMN